MRAPILMVVLSVVISSTACSDPAQIDPRGSYATSGTWQVSGPFSDGRTPGDVAAEILVDTAVGLSGVPSVAHDKAGEILSAAIADDVAGVVDAQLPADLRSGSALYNDLATVLADLDVESSLVVTDHTYLPGKLSGSETVSAVSVMRNGTLHSILPAAISESGALHAEWSASPVGDASLYVEAHEFAVSYAALVRWAAVEVLGRDEVDSYAAQASAAVDCSAAVTVALHGQTAIQFSVEDVSYALTAGQLSEACLVARAEIASRLLGMFDRGVVELGGSVQIVDLDGDLRADVLATESFAGNLLLPPLPNAAAPRVTAAFVATRND